MLTPTSSVQHHVTNLTFGLTTFKLAASINGPTPKETFRNGSGTKRRKFYLIFLKEIRVSPPDLKLFRAGLV